MALNPNIRKIDSNVFAGQVDQGNPNLGRDWANAFGALTQAGDKIQQSIEDKKEKEQKERLLAKDEYLEAKDTFNVPEVETDNSVIKSAKIEASNDLANEAAELSRLYRTGKIDLEEFKASNAKLTQALGGINKGDAYINGIAGTYSEMSTEPDSISNATSPEAIAVAKSISEGTIVPRWNKETNKLEYTGTWKDADGVEHDVKDIPVGKENRFPRNVKKAADPKLDLLNLNVEINKNFQDTSIKNGIEFTGTSWDDPQVQAAYDGKISEIVGNSDQLLSIATDHLNISRKQAYAMLDQPVETGGNALQAAVTAQLKAQAESQFFGNEKGRVSAGHTIARQNRQDELNAQKHEWQKENANRANRIAKGTGTATDRQFQRTVLDAKENLRLLDKSIDSGDYTELLKLPGISNVKQYGEKIKIYDQSGKSFYLPKDLQQRQQVLQNFLGIGGAIQQELNDQSQTQTKKNKLYEDINTGRPKT